MRCASAFSIAVDSGRMVHRWRPVAAPFSDRAGIAPAPGAEPPPPAHFVTGADKMPTPPSHCVSSAATSLPGRCLPSPSLSPRYTPLTEPPASARAVLRSHKMLCLILLAVVASTAKGKHNWHAIHSDTSCNVCVVSHFPFSFYAFISAAIAMCIEEGMHAWGMEAQLVAFCDDWVVACNLKHSGDGTVPASPR